MSKPFVVGRTSPIIEYFYKCRPESKRYNIGRTVRVNKRFI